MITFSHDRNLTFFAICVHDPTPVGTYSGLDEARISVCTGESV